MVVRSDYYLISSGGHLEEVWCGVYNSHGLLRVKSSAVLRIIKVFRRCLLELDNINTNNVFGSLDIKYHHRDDTNKREHKESFPLCNLQATSKFRLASSSNLIVFVLSLVKSVLKMFS